MCARSQHKKSQSDNAPHLAPPHFSGIHLSRPQVRPQVAITSKLSVCRSLLLFCAKFFAMFFAKRQFELPQLGPTAAHKSALKSAVPT